MLRYRSSGGFVIEPQPIDAAKVPAVPDAISIELSGKNLDFKDWNLRCDPFIEVKARQQGRSDKWVTIHRSPVQKKTRDPKWPAFSISSALVGGVDTVFRIVVWDFDSDGGHDLIGVAETTLRNLSLGPFVMPIIHPTKKARAGYRSSGALNLDKVTPVAAASLPPVPPAMRLTFSGKKLDRKDSIRRGGAADPMYEIRRIFEGSDETALIYRSEVCSKTLAPVWQPVDLSLQQFGDADTPFLVRVIDSDPQDGLHDLIGQFVTTLREWMFGPYAHALIHPDKAGRVGYESSGGFYIDVVQPLPASPLPAPPAFVSLSIEADNWDTSYDSPFLEAWALSNTIGPILVHRSEYGASKSGCRFAPVTFDVAAIGGLDTLLAFKLNWMNEKKGKVSLVGGSHATLREFIASREPTFLPQINPKKKKRVPKYTSSATLKVTVVPVDQSHLPRFRPATAYKLTCTVVDSKKSAGSVGVYASPIGVRDKRLVKLFESSYGTNSFEVLLPFEAAGGLDQHIGFTHRRGRFEVTLRELAFAANQFYFRKDKKGRKKPFKRCYAGMLNIVSVEPILYHVAAWTMQVECIRLDWKSATSVTPNPFLQVLAPQPPSSPMPYMLVHTSEVISQSRDITLAPFAIDVRLAGGMDTPLLFRLLSKDPTGDSLIGEFEASLRSFILYKERGLTHPLKAQLYVFLGAVNFDESFAPPYSFELTFYPSKLYCSITNYKDSGRLVVKQYAPVPSQTSLPPPFSLELMQRL
jgi:hypothetical protein